MKEKQKGDEKAEFKVYFSSKQKCLQKSKNGIFKVLWSTMSISWYINMVISMYYRISIRYHHRCTAIVLFIRVIRL